MTTVKEAVDIIEALSESKLVEAVKLVIVLSKLLDQQTDRTQKPPYPGAVHDALVRADIFLEGDM